MIKERVVVCALAVFAHGDGDADTQLDTEHVMLRPAERAITVDIPVQVDVIDAREVAQKMRLRLADTFIDLIIRAVLVVFILALPVHIVGWVADDDSYWRALLSFDPLSVGFIVRGSERLPKMRLQDAHDARAHEVDDGLRRVNDTMSIGKARGVALKKSARKQRSRSTACR